MHGLTWAGGPHRWVYCAVQRKWIFPWYPELSLYSSPANIVWKDFKYERCHGYSDEECVFSSGQEFAETAFPCSLGGEWCWAHRPAASHGCQVVYSRGKFLARFMELLPEIKDFLKLSECVDFHAKLEDPQWLLDLAFLTDLTCKLNEFNLDLQGKGKDAVNMMSSVNTFKSKLQLMSSRLQRGNLHDFPHMQAELWHQGKGVTQLDSARYDEHVQSISSEFERRLLTLHQSSLESAICVIHFVQILLLVTLPSKSNHFST